MRKRMIPIVLLGIAVLLGIFFWQDSSRSPYTSEPSADVITLTQETQYPIATEKIVVSVMNCGEYSGEINKPHLEVECDGKWHTVKKETQEDETANLLYVLPGETKEFEIVLTPYGQDLIPGRYRAVFTFCESDEHYAYQFDLVEAS